MKYINELINGESLEILKKLPSSTYRCCVTSPPYWQLRDYKTGVWSGGNEGCNHRILSAENHTCKCGAAYKDEQIGLEKSPEEFIMRLSDVFDEVKRVMTDDGTLWINIGDSYVNGSLKNGLDSKYKYKDLVGIPWMLAFELRKRGWYLRSDIIWHKPNSHPESVKDRPTRCHEYIFLLSKSERYFYDYKAIRELANYDGRNNFYNGSKKYATNEFRPNNTKHLSMGRKRNRWVEDEDGNFVRNKRSVWSIPTKPTTDNHFAAYPPELVEICIKAGTEVGDLVLDPFIGTGVTALKSLLLNRKFTGIDLNFNNIEISKTKIKDLSYF